MESNVQILCTRPLNEALISDAEMAGINIEELSFIETEPIESIEVQQEIEQAFLLTATVVFTSMNAVEAVANFQEENEPAWDIYCMGNTTRKLVSKYFGAEKIADTANDATELADSIVESGNTDQAIFFCGDQRRDELPSILRKNGLDVTEVVVYQTIAVPHKINKVYNGILFFSPSAVASFFQKNKLPPSTILFAIGNTTANEIKKFTANKIIIGNQPAKENLVQMAIEYFT